MPPRPEAVGEVDHQGMVILGNRCVGDTFGREITQMSYVGDQLGIARPVLRRPDMTLLVEAHLKTSPDP